MSEIVYSDLQHQHSSQLQRPQELQKPKRKVLSDFRHEDVPAPSSWKITAVILGIICLVLLSSVGFLATKLIKNSFNVEGYQGNKTVNQNSFNAERHPGNISCNKEVNKTVWKCLTCPNDWYQRGENCYLLSRNKNFWNQCSSHCTGLNSNFLKVDTEEEMKFLIKLSMMQCEILQRKFFISLHYNREQLKWVWLDGTEIILDKFQIPRRGNADKKCIHIKYDQINAEDCQNSGYCICKKTI